MGTKRLGLARTQALIENLKRDIEAGDLALKNLRTKQPASNEAGPRDDRESPQPASFSFLYDSGSYESCPHKEVQLSGSDGKVHTGLPIGFVATHGYVEVVTAPTSTGSATIAIGTAGTSNDPDGFLTASAIAELAVNKVRSFNGALVSNGGDPEHASGFDQRGYRVVTTADPVTVTVATADLTAAKFYVHIHGFMSKG